ncbi:uncharacterized protein [Anabrus simplex]|uniref:uncharacterized protein n=1 Tax=Anabrus simplex TaxID=316456 RepID=UPI0035A2D53F
MSDLAADLNYDCNYNMFLTKTMLNNLKSRTDRTCVMKWLNKLSNCNRSIDEMRLRNDFMYYLVLNVQNGELRPPFNSNPPAGKLQAQLLPGGTDVIKKETSSSHPCLMKETGKQKQDRPVIYQNSPDGGAFLAAQPIPRCGAFCYLAVTVQIVAAQKLFSINSSVYYKLVSSCRGGAALSRHTCIGDDTSVIVGSEEDLTDLFAGVKNTSLHCGLKINVKKTTLMVVDRQGQIQLTGCLKDLEIVKEFVYLGPVTNGTGICYLEIKRRTVLDRSAMVKLTKIWQNWTISKATKMRLVE